MGSIFISHTHGDKPIADAFARLVQTLFSDKVTVNYSSKKDLDGGIGPGADWFQWIVDQVKQSDLAVIFLTPASIQKPWLLWEAGAVAGASYAVANKNARVIPISFGLRSAEIPTPFARLQVVIGVDHADVLKLVDDLINRFSDGLGLSPAQLAKLGSRSEGAIKEFIAEVDEVLLRLPQIVTEATIQEWLARLEEIEESGRSSETEVLENWLDVAVGRESSEQQRPLDVRIHRRLGELYASGKKASDAVRQFKLARSLAPRDIFLLRQLGKAYLDVGSTREAGDILDAIEKLDGKAFERNAENAALKARWHEQEGNAVAACEVLEKAYGNLAQSYYLGDRLGQMLLRLKEVDKAKKVYLQVIGTIDDLREQNVWTLASKLTASIVCEEEKNVQETLKELAKRKPSRGDLDSIERGAKGVLEALGRDTNILRDLQKMEAAA